QEAGASDRTITSLRSRSFWSADLVRLPSPTGESHQTPLGWCHPPLIADRRKSSPPWINIISSSAKSFTKPLKQLALQPSEPQSSCRQPHKNRPSGRQHVVVHASVRSLTKQCGLDVGRARTPDG